MKLQPCHKRLIVSVTKDFLSEILDAEIDIISNRSNMLDERILSTLTFGKYK